MNKEMHWELNFYKDKRKKKARIHRARVERGYNFKKKKTKEQWEFEKMLLQNRPHLEDLLKEDFKVEVINPK